MEKERMISVILPVKDGDMELLRRAIGSVMQQNYQNFEVLLVDDGSGESVRRELDHIAGTDGRICVIHIEASGVSAARNLALEKAKGEIITWLDSDDAVAPGCFAEAVRMLEDPAIDALWGGTRFVNAEEMRTLRSKQSIAGKNQNLTDDKKAAEVGTGCDKYTGELIPLTPERLHRSRAECIGEPYRFGDGGYINRGIAARFIRREALLKNALYFPPGFRMYEDTIWNLEMMEKLRVYYVPRIWYYYYDNSVSASNRFHADGLERIEVPLNWIREMLDLENEEEYTAYTRFLMDSLRYVCQTMYLHPEWKPEKAQKEEIKRHLWHDEPWKEIGSARFRACAEKRDRQKAILYRLRLLLTYWRISGRK